MLCTHGMEAFLSNALAGILRAGIAPSQIVICSPPNAADTIRDLASARAPGISVEVDSSLTSLTGAQYARFGTPAFNAICWAKIDWVQRLLDRHEHVVYADLDIGWLRNPLPYLVKVAEHYPLAFQTEGRPSFPPALCCGFVSLRRSDRTSTFLKSLLARRNANKQIDDQTACNSVLIDDPSWLKDIYLLPETLFVNGLGYRIMQKERMPLVAMEDELQPFLFHANWTVGLANKRKLLAMLPGALADEVGADAATTLSARHDDCPLVSVLYPIFDVRGDVTAHVRNWVVQQQGITAEQFQIVVAAGTETPLDETALREVLRPSDRIVRVPRARQDTELWNAAAGAAAAPWLLFVEAHGWPGSDALATLMSWINANPDKRACNFRIGNPDSYRMARLMKRWFAQTQGDWARPTTWQRLHRTAFALRRDVFERLGPIAPFGQFGPALLSARLHQRNVDISALPASGVLHEDSTKMLCHIEDTTDYARGELEARISVHDQEFFDSYFGPSPFHGVQPILTAAFAFSLLRSLVTASIRRPGSAAPLSRQAARLIPSLLPLRLRRAWLVARIKFDAFRIMRTAISNKTAWALFTTSHQAIVRAEKMRWMIENPLPPITASLTISAAELTRHSIIGLHTLERVNSTAIRWSHPTLQLRLAAGRKVTVTITTRNLRPGLAARHLEAVAIGGKTVAIDVTPSADVVLQAELPSTASGITDLILIAQELVEAGLSDTPGRRLGLPIFEIEIAFDCAEQPRKLELGAAAAGGSLHIT